MDRKSTSNKRKLDQLNDSESKSDQLVSEPLNKKTKISTSQQNENIFLTDVDLPREIHHHIISFITDDDQRRQIRLVCRDWFNVINYNTFKIGVLLASEKDEFCRIFSRYNKPIGLKFVKMDYIYDNASRDTENDNLMTIKQLSRMIRKLTQLNALDLRVHDINISKKLTNLRELTTITPLRESVAPKFTNLQKLVLTMQRDGISVEQIPPNLEYFDHDGTFGRQYFSEPNTRLTNLKIRTAHADSFLESHPSVRVLNIRDYGPYLDYEDYAPLLPNLEKLVTNVNAPKLYGSRLTQLKISIIAIGQDLVLTSNLTNLKILECRRVDFSPDLALPSLESCIIDDSNSNKTVLEHLNSSLMKQLRVTVTRDNYEQFVKFTKLTDLQLTSDTQFQPNLPPMPYLTKLNVFDLPLHQFASSCPNLVNLRFGLKSDPSQKVLSFASFTALTILTIESSHSFDIDIRNLTNLRKLIFQDPRVESRRININGLSTLTNLMTLAFTKKLPFYSNGKQKVLKNWSDLSHLTNLRELIVLQEYNKDDITNLVPLQKLTYLEVARDVTSLGCLTKLSQLQCLTLNESSGSNPIPSDMWTKFPFCWDCRLHLK